MARYNTIWAGPDSENMPQKVEAIASAALVPGYAVTLGSTGQFEYAVAASAGQVFFLQDNYLMMKNVDTAYTSGDTAQGLVILDEQFYNVKIATGVSVARGQALALGAAGTLVAATSGSRIVCYADETYNNTTGSAQLIRVRGTSGYRLA